MGLWTANGVKVIAGAMGATTVLPNIFTNRGWFTTSSLTGLAVFAVLAAIALVVHYASAERLGEGSPKEKADE